MGIYSRSYMRDDYPKGGGRSFDALKTILVSLVAVFLVQMIARWWIGTPVILEFFALHLGGLKNGLVYTLLTYGYLHDTESALPLHLLINALVLYFVGRILQMRLGSARLFEFFNLSILAGGLAWIPVALLQGHTTPLVGASAGVFGFLSLFALFTWNETIRLMLFFVMPVELRGKTIFYILLGMQGFFFLFSELPAQRVETTAYSAHLGGILFAYLYHRYLLSKPTLWNWLKGNRGPSVKKPVWQQRGEAAKRKGAGRFKLNLGGKASEPSPDRSSSSAEGNGHLRAEVDRILDKINSKGFGSLTDAEKRTLDRAKDRLK